LVSFVGIDKAILMSLEGEIPNEYFGYLFLKLQKMLQENLLKILTRLDYIN